MLSKTHRALPEHRVVAEAALGKPLPKGAVIHHVNEIKSDNRNSNLVICENEKYHRLIHARQRIVDAGGDPDVQKICATCKQLKNHSSYSLDAADWSGRKAECRHCTSIRDRQRRVG
jgi:hypothetical protein